MSQAEHYLQIVKWNRNEQSVTLGRDVPVACGRGDDVENVGCIEYVNLRSGSQVINNNRKK